MKKVIQRLLVFLIGVPVILGLVVFLPWRHQLPLNIVVILFTATGALEFSNMLAKKQLFTGKAEAFILGALLPLAGTLVISFNCPAALAPAVFMTAALWIILSRVFAKAEALDSFINRLAAGFSVLLYPGAFMYWLVKMSAWRNAGPVTFVFLMISIGNDSAAWAAGMLWGKGNRGIVAASPNKSIAGFAGGTFGSMVVSVGAALIVPRFFAPRYDLIPGLPPFLLPALAIGLLPGIAAMLGDLCESAIKRSSGFKDSGNIMLGRGGVLDSIDSIAAAAPVFYLVFSLLFIQ